LAIGPTNVVALRRRCDLRSVFTGRCPPRAGIDARAGYRRVVDHAIGWPWRDTAFDAAAVVAAAAISAFMVLGSRPILEPLGGAMIAGQVGLALCLLFRRRAPLALAWAATAAAAAIAIVELAAPGSIVPTNLSPDDIPWLPAAAPFAAYSAMAYARDRRAAWLPVVALTVIGTHRWNAPPNSPWLLQSLLFIGGPALLGTYLTARRRLLRSLTDRTERAEREQHLLAERARADERSRLAVEMHDLVTHRVSLMVLQSGALRITTREEATRAAAEELRTTGCQALEELRDLVGILRDTTPDRHHDAPAGRVQAAVPDLAALVSQSESIGVPVDLVEEGDPSRASPVVGRTAYRIVQEALTNVRKHAPGARVQVHLRYRADGVRLSIRNSPPTDGQDPLLAATGTGTGLLGLRQRVELINGTLHAGPDHDGGFRVDATLPAYIPTDGSLEPSL
jgi:signal transduction histidine kinase